MKNIFRSPLRTAATLLLATPLVVGSACRLLRAQQNDGPPADAGQPVTIQIDATARRHAISPLVYGVSYAGDNASALHCPIDRMGGNSTTRYNWRENADSRGADWFFESIADKDKTPGGRANDFVHKDRVAHAESMLTVPIIGWVAHVNDDRSSRWSFSVAKYGRQEKADPYAADAGNGDKSNGMKLTGNDPHDANMPVDVSFMRPWIAQLTQTFGTAKAGGVGYYVLDNEPALWSGTHRDVSPVGVKMDELFAKMRDTATMIKSVDPSAQVVGPEEWGWTGYLYSGYDAQYGGVHGWSNLPDGAAHGGALMMPWLLKQFAQNEKQTGKRLLDVFSLHYYPQGGEFGDDVSPAMQLRRNRSTRSLWDLNYQDESWIKDSVHLVPRMKEWVATNYPGTKIGLTEYSWGAEKHINGATAEADILGILGREGMDIANRWTCPDPQSVAFKAMQMYRNYDGHDGTFGGTSVACDAPNPDAVSAFAAQDEHTGALTIMVVAKTPNVASTAVTLALSHFAGKTAHIYQLTAANEIAHLPDAAPMGGALKITVPAQSITLIVVPKG